METIKFSNISIGTNMASQTPMLMPLLESSVPGLSLFTRFLSEYLHIDITQHLGLILVLIGVFTAMNYCYDRAYSLFSDYFMSTAEIRYNDEIYNYLMYWISRNGLSQRTTKFVAGTNTNSKQVYMADDSEDEDFDMDEESDLNDENLKAIRNWDRVKTLRFTPSTGVHYFKYKGHLITFQRSQEVDKNWWGNSTKEEVYLSCFGRNTQILKDLLQEAQISYLERDGNKTIIYRASRPYGGTSDDREWIRCMSRPPRPLSTVVLDEAQKQLILADMKEYLHPRTKKWYSNRGIPYRRGYLLHGPPGTGKTSLCFALAGVLQLRIYVANLNSKNLTEDTLSTLFRDLPARCIVLLEDIDSAGLAVSRKDDQSVIEAKTNSDDTQKSSSETTGAAAGPNLPSTESNESSNKGISLSGFLNIIDGVASSEGRILVMTTNHMEKLDKALLRPGRCDLIVHFSYANSDMIKGLFLAIYSTVDADRSKAKKNEESKSRESSKPSTPTLAPLGAFHRPLGMHSHGKTEEEIARMAEEFAGKLTADKYTPAELQGYLLKHKTDPEGALEELDAWIEEKENAVEKS
jgi:mitochondrial chaperone BCS1